MILYNNAMISFNMIEAARLNEVKRFYYASSACIYPEGRQLDTKNPGLKESDAWPAQPQDAYGLEKLASEELAIHYGKDFGMETRVGRFQYVLCLPARRCFIFLAFAYQVDVFPCQLPASRVRRLLLADAVWSLN